MARRRDGSERKEMYSYISVMSSSATPTLSKSSERFDMTSVATGLILQLRKNEWRNYHGETSCKDTTRTHQITSLGWRRSIQDISTHRNVMQQLKYYLEANSDKLLLNGTCAPVQSYWVVLFLQLYIMASKFNMRFCAIAHTLMCSCGSARSSVCSWNDIFKMAPCKMATIEMFPCKTALLT